MENKIEDSKTSKAKLAYLLSSCHLLPSLLFKNLINKFAKTQIVATRHYFNVFIKFKKHENEKSYLIDSIEYDFIGQYDDLIKKIFIKFVSDNLKPIPYINISNLVSSNYKNSLLCLLNIKALIKYFSNNYNYLFIPIIINYGTASYINHQTALIINLKEKIFLFYEPYGKYSKFGLSYINIMRIFCNNIDNTYNYDTYHNYFNLTNGIQNIILIKNNNLADISNFENKFLNILSKFNELTMNNNSYNANNYNKYTFKSKNNYDDKTLQCIFLLDSIDHYIIKIKQNVNKQEFYKLYEDILQLYHGYNSKTCVSITLVELKYFFENIKSIEVERLQNPTNAITINKLYNQFTDVDLNDDNNMVNTILMNKIYQLVVEFSFKKNLLNYLSSREINSQEICNNIFI